MGGGWEREKAEERKRREVQIQREGENTPVTKGKGGR